MNDYPSLPSVYFTRREPTGQLLGIPYGGTVFVHVDVPQITQIRLDLTRFSVNSSTGGFYPDAVMILPPSASAGPFPSLSNRLPGNDP